MGPRIRLPDRRLLILLAGTLATLVLAWTVKSPCLDHAWDGHQYRQLCYNDLQPLYGARGLHEDKLPYVETFVEYPVLTGLLMYAAALPSTNHKEFFLWNALLLSLLALGTTLLLYHMVDDKRRVALYAAAPPLVLYAFHNWDLLAVFLTTLGLYYYQRGKNLHAGTALALGAAAKLYPALLLIVLGLRLLHREDGLGPQGWRFGLSAVTTLVAVNLPFLLANPALWWETYAFHLQRPPNYETPWYVAFHYAEAAGHDPLAILAQGPLLVTLVTLVFVALVAWIGTNAFRGRLPPYAAALAILLAFLVTNKIYSVQYALWVTPFLTLLRVPWTLLGAFLLTDAAVYLGIFHYFTGPDVDFAFTAVSVLARAATLVALLVWTLRTKPHRALFNPAETAGGTT